MNSPKPEGTGPHRKFLVMGILVLLGIALAGALPAYRLLKETRAHWIVRDAEGLLEQGDKIGALQNGAAAYQLAPLDEKVLFLMARLYAEVNPEYALFFWDQLRQRKELDSTERAAFARFVIRLGQPALAAGEIEKIFQDKGAEDPMLLLAAEYCLATAQTDRAAEICGALLKRSPGDQAARYLLAQIYMRSNRWPQAKNELETLAHGDGPFSLQALTLLARTQGATGSELEFWRQKILKHPQAGEKERLLAEEMRIRIEPAKKLEILNAVADRAKSGKPEEKLESARWLNNRGEYGRVQDLLTVDEALQRRDLFLVWADAMAAGGRWQELDAVLERKPVPLELPLVTAFRARCVRELQQNKRSELLWEQAISEATAKPEILWFMVAYAEKLKAYDLARKACQRLTREPATQRAAYLTLLRLAESQKNTRDLRDTMAELNRLYPQEKAAANDLAYLNLLLGEKVEESAALAFEQQRQDPLIMAYRVTAALALLRQGNGAKALVYYEGLDTAQLNSLRPRWKVIYAALLGSSGKTERAKEIAKATSEDLLLPEEKVLLQSYR